MMKKSRSSLFLMELIVVIFFFSLTAAVCLQIFVKAHTLGEKTKNLNNAVLLAQNTGELFYEYGEDFPRYQNLISDMAADNLSVSFALNSDEDFLYLDYICYVSGDSEPLYRLSFKRNIQEVAK